MDHFEHEKLDVYKAAIDFVAIAAGVIERLRRATDPYATNFKEPRPASP